MNAVKEAAEKLLTDLGDTLEQIADNLQGQGITGDLRSSESCPLANYLARELNGVVHVSYMRIYVFLDGEAVVWDLSDTLYDFVLNFDWGNFPKLIKRGEST